MPWKMTVDDSGTYEQPPTGPQPAVLTRIIDIGTHTDVSPQYGETTRHQVILMFELAELMTNGEPYTIQKFYTLSTNERANLRKDYESWRGRAFETGETMDVTAPLGQACLLGIMETENKKSKISSISRLPKGMEPPTPRGELLVFRTDEPDWAVFEKLSEFHRGKIEKSKEWAGMKSHAEMRQNDSVEGQYIPAESRAASAACADFDDDIPF